MYPNTKYPINETNQEDFNEMGMSENFNSGQIGSDYQQTPVQNYKMPTVMTSRRAREETRKNLDMFNDLQQRLLM